MMMRGRMQLARTVAIGSFALAFTMASSLPSAAADPRVKWPGTLMVGDTPCGEMYLTIGDGIDGARTFTWHIDGCAPLENVVSGTPVPTATPRVTPTPAPTPVGTVSPGDPELCPDGYITEPASKTDPWYGVTVDIPLGVTKVFCAPITSPLVTTAPSQIAISWYDVSDQDCAGLDVRVDAVDPPLRPRGGTGYPSSGTFYYYAKIGTRVTPEQTARGIYVITATGGSAACSRYRIAWRVYY